MIARELRVLRHARGARRAGPRSSAKATRPFLSNVNAAYRRDCWEALRFPEIAYSEDQAFARAMLEAGWAKAYVPPPRYCTRTTIRRRSSCSATSTSTGGCVRPLGHVEPFGVRSTDRDVRALVPPTVRGWREQG